MLIQEMLDFRGEKKDMLGYDLKDDSKIFSLVFPSVDFQVEL